MGLAKCGLCRLLVENGFSGHQRVTEEYKNLEGKGKIGSGEELHGPLSTPVGCVPEYGGGLL